MICICAAVFAGCKKQNVGTEEDNAAPKEETEEKTSYKFGFSCIAKDNPYYVTLGDAISEELRKDGHILLGRNDDTNLDAQTQIEQIQSLIDEGIDAIFLTPVDCQQIEPALEALKEADVKIINLDARVTDLDAVDAYIGSDNQNAGKICGEDLFEKHPDGGKVAILECPTMNSINERITGFEEALAGKPFEVVARENVSGDLNKSREAANKILKENKDIIAIMCGNDQAAVGACVAANEMKMEKLNIYSVDGSPEIKKELEKDNTYMAGTVAQSPITIGKEAVKTAMKILNGEKYEKETYLETYLITKENIEMYGSDGWQ